MAIQFLRSAIGSLAGNGNGRCYRLAFGVLDSQSGKTAFKFRVQRLKSHRRALQVPIRRVNVIFVDVRNSAAAAIAHHLPQFALHDFEDLVHTRLAECAESP